MSVYVECLYARCDQCDAASADLRAGEDSALRSLFYEVACAECDLRELDAGLRVRFLALLPGWTWVRAAYGPFIYCPDCSEPTP